MVSASLKLAGLVACASLLPVSFFGTRALLRAETAPNGARPPATPVEKQRVVQLPFAATLDLVALTDDAVFEARGALVRALQNQLIRHPACLDSSDGAVRGTVRASYRLAARGGAVHATLIGEVKYLPESSSRVSASLESCLISKVEHRFAVAPSRTRLTHEGDLGEKTFELPVGNEAGVCGM